MVITTTSVTTSPVLPATPPVDPSYPLHAARPRVTDRPEGHGALLTDGTEHVPSLRGVPDLGVTSRTTGGELRPAAAGPRAGDVLLENRHDAAAFAADLVQHVPHGTRDPLSDLRATAP